MNGIKKNNPIGSTIAIISLCFFFSAGIYIYAHSREQVIICLLPITYVVAILLSGAWKRFTDTSSPGFMLINYLYFIKCCVYPFLSVISNTSYISKDSDAILAIMLEIFEIIIIYLVYGLYNRRKNEAVADSFSYELVSDRTASDHFVLYCFLLFAVACMIIEPSSLKAYNFFNVKSVDVINAGVEESASSSTVVDFTISIARHIALVCLVGNCYDRYSTTKKTRYVVYSVLIVCLSMMIVRGVSRSNFVMPGICGIYLLVKLYPRQKRVIAGGLLVALGLFFIMFTIMRFGVYSDIDDFTKMLQSYFCCDKNMIISIRARATYHDSIGFKTLFSDLLGNWMGVGHYFRSSHSISEIFNFQYHNSTVAIDQIVPTVGESYMQFGLLGTYLYTIVMTFICLKFDEKYKRCGEIDFSYLYLYGTVKCAVTLMGNFKIFSATAFNVLIPMWLLFYVNKKLTYSKRSGFVWNCM